LCHHFEGTYLTLHQIIKHPPYTLYTPPPLPYPTPTYLLYLLYSTYLLSNIPYIVVTYLGVRILLTQLNSMVRKERKEGKKGKKERRKEGKKERRKEGKNLSSALQKTRLQVLTF